MLSNPYGRTPNKAKTTTHQKTPLTQAFQPAQNRKTKTFRILLSAYFFLLTQHLLHPLILFAWIVFQRMVWRKFCWWHTDFHIHGAAKKRDKSCLTWPLARIYSISFSVGKRMVPSSLIGMGKLSCLWLMT